MRADELDRRGEAQRVQDGYRVQLSNHRREGVLRQSERGVWIGEEGGVHVGHILGDERADGELGHAMLIGLR